jgi:peptidoglycan/LPS O-acetylase OafA/YrhL
MNKIGLMTDSATKGASTPHSKNIDAIRGLAILGVVECHYFALTNIYDRLGFPKLLVNVLTSGGAGVDLFFVLSAFLLCRGLFRTGREPLTVFNFYRRRALRILPGYLVLLALGFGLRPFFKMDDVWSNWLWGGVYDPIFYLLFLQNWLIGQDGVWHGNVFAHTWSLAVEEQFYLILPLVAKGTGKRGLASIACIMVLSGIPARIMLSDLVSDIAGYCWSIARLDAFGWGILIALALDRWPDLSSKLSPALLARTSGALFAVYNGIFFTRQTNSAYLAIIDVLAAMLVLAAALVPEGSSLEDHVIHRSLAWMGKRCYSIYLFHNAIFGLTLIIAQEFLVSMGFAGFLAAVIIALIITLCVADISYRRIEKPFISLGQPARDFSHVVSQPS